MDYQKKYLKYKTKYVNYKKNNIVGGELKYECTNQNAPLVKDLCTKTHRGTYQTMETCIIPCIEQKFANERKIQQPVIQQPVIQWPVVQPVIQRPAIPSREPFHQWPAIPSRGPSSRWQVAGDKYKKNTHTLNLKGDMVDIMKIINTPYQKRDNKSGIYYSDDYANKYIPYLLEQSNSLNGITNDKYWDIWKIQNEGCFFRILEHILPSDALNAFFIGPTMADCGNVIQVCIYQHILNHIGTDKFNQIFGKPLTRFIITQYLYDNFYTELDTKKAIGNPLYFLFDVIENIKIDQLQHGDIVYIKGVDKYGMKHLVGFSPGWNLLCEKIDNEIKFIGFGPDSFGSNTMNYADIHQLLINNYNQEQSAETKRRIEYFSKEIITSTIDPTNIHNMNYLHATNANILKDDKVPLDYPIGGLTNCIRFNMKKLNNFINKKWHSWHQINDDEYNKLMSKMPINPIPIKFLIPFSTESANSDFDNYKISNSEQQKLYTMCKKFAFGVSTMDKQSGPIGLIMSGTPGIGKTHLSVSIAKFVSSHGKKILYVDEKYISDHYQKSGGRFNIFYDWFRDIDLIIIDDINANLGIGFDFFKQAIEYVISNSKAILLSSNIKFFGLSDSLPEYISYDDPIADNFIFMQDIEIKSYRIPWTKNLINETVQSLCEYDKKHPAGILVFSKSDNRKNNLEQYQKLYLDCIQSKKITQHIKLVEDPYLNQRVHDLYVLDADNYDICIINVYNKDDAEQLLNLIIKMHDKAGKIIVITSSLDNFRQLINDVLTPTSWLESDKKFPRIKDRFKNMFPGIL